MTFAPSPEQAAILDLPLSSLRINAGAGTGKTTTLTKKIVGLVAGGMHPGRILGLTFTNKAAGELSQRVSEELRELTSEVAEAEIHTYHGFAYQLLAEFGPFVGVDRDVTVITPTFSRQLLLEAVNGAPTYDHLILSQRERVIDATLRLASDLGDNLAEPESLFLESDDPVVLERREMAEVIARFRLEKQRLGVIDFADLVRLAHELATAHPQLAERVKERYDVVFLDEYQDTNAGQRLLLQALFGEGFPVIAVGDPDQTIYEWRGATPSNFNRFPEHFPAGDGSVAETRHLTLNRRSGQRILDVANSVRQLVGGSARQPLNAAPGTPRGTVTASWYRTSWDEATAIADRLKEAHESGTPWKEMAVLFRTNAAITIVRLALAEAEIPAEVASAGGLLDIPEIVEIHAWLRLIQDPGDNVAFARIAMGAQYRLNRSQLKTLAAFLRFDQPDTPQPSFIEALDHPSAIDTSSPRVVSAFRSIRENYSTMLQAAQGASLAELVRQVLDLNDMWREIEAMPGVAALSARLNVYRFLDLAEAWSPLEGRSSLPAFLDYLALLALQKTDELDTARVSQESAVILLTVHRAKGLEWDLVCLPGLTQGLFPSGVREFEDPYARAWVLPFNHRIDQLDLPQITQDMDKKERQDILRVRHLSQEWRLAYVAVTRARSQLHTSGAFWGGNEAPRKSPVDPSPFLTVVADLCDTGTWEVDPGERPDHVHPLDPTVVTPDPLFDDGWAHALQAAVADSESPTRQAAELNIHSAYAQAVADYEDMLFALPEPPDSQVPSETRTTSVTGMVTAARCPLQFRWSEIDRLPRRPSRAARRGTEVHRKIELHNMGQVPLEDFSAMEYDVPSVSEPASDTSAPYQTYLASRFAEARPIFTETAFSFRVGGTTLRGRVDAIYARDEGWEIVDFKSGRPSTDPSLVTQLEAYALAAASGALGPAPESMWVTFAYLGDGLTEITKEVTPAWLAEAKNHMESVSIVVQDGPYVAAPSEACGRCDFRMFCDAGKAWLTDH